MLIVRASEIDYTAVGTSVATVFKPDRAGDRYVLVLYWRDASHKILGYCIRGLHPSEYCITGMHLLIHYTTVLEGCIY